MARLIPNPIHKVLSTLSCHEVKHLLMGGQACVFYGAAEFSRDCDIVVLTDPDNFTRLERALDDLQAECIAVPPMEWRHLDRGHAIHFRCQHPDAYRIRLDVMSRMRGCGPFDALWKRRTTITDDDGSKIELLGIEDLVKAKKTQRDKDWPMIRRLVDAHYEQHRSDTNEARVRFWLRELRTAESLIAVGAEFPDLLDEERAARPLLDHVLKASRSLLDDAIQHERQRETTADKAYWDPLKRELEVFRRERHAQEGESFH